MGVRRRFGLLLLVGALGALLFVLAQDQPGQAALPTASIVASNPNYEMLAVDPSGEAWGTPTTARNQLWKSGDEGGTWTQVTTWIGQSDLVHHSAAERRAPDRLRDGHPLDLRALR